METKIYKLNEENIDHQAIKAAVEVIRNNGTVVFPTETVYGLGANALSAEAAKAIFVAKGRPSDNPLIVHVDCIDMLLYVIGEPLSENAKKLMEKFWPGPLTLIFKKSSAIPPEITAGLDTVGVRMPDNIIALELIKQSGLPIAAPSANISGKPSPTKDEHVIADLDGKVDAILCGSSSRIGLESTVLDLSGAVPTILRPGGITLEELQAVLGEVHIDKGLVDQATTPKAPGMKYTHYAPEAKMIIIKGQQQEVVSKIQQLTAEQENQGKLVGILATEETKQNYQSGIVISMGSRSNLYSAAAAIFDALRQFDIQKVDIIYAEALSEENIGMAVMNRLKKAAGFNIIEV
ncbi:MAG: threonylcarbamoyl-AMP synthase [Clostridia bacterium]|jgi:L-threonylcarbamoyladenylate synthase|nr:threonylcarbamoyl-AMP synthase [Clostridia bacterium]